MVPDVYSQLPVLLIVFNRPIETLKVFNEIAKAKPPKLFFAADGARTDRPGEAEKCAQVREIINKVNWPCQVYTDLAPLNLGCKKRVSSAITWALSNVDEVIILEDDTVPSPDFFTFMNELIPKYRDQSHVMMISGVNHDKRNTTDSYYFTQFGAIWGWATWRRAWKLYDPEMKTWPEFKKSQGLKRLFKSHYLTHVWKSQFEATYDGRIDTWDHQWTYCMIKNRGYSVQPTANLVSNIGFGTDATHTKTANELSAQKYEHLELPLRHPAQIRIDPALDEKYQARQKNFIRRVLNRLRRGI